MNVNKLVMFNHDVFCGACDAYDLLILVESLCFIKYHLSPLCLMHYVIRVDLETLDA